MTTIKQSKDLLKAGIDAYTADMHYHYTRNGYVPMYGKSNGAEDIPAWSLECLIEMLPPFVRMGKLTYMLSMTKRTIGYIYKSEYDFRVLYTFEEDKGLIYAVVKTIIVLKKDELI